MGLELEQERIIDFTQPIHPGVLGDRVVKDRRGLRVREITFQNPWDGKGYGSLPSEMTLAPGRRALRCKTRWEIEKVFDETKTKLQEKKSWATTPTAKQMPSPFVAIGHNLLLRLQDLHQPLGVENIAEIQRKQKRRRQQETELAKNQQTLPLVYKILQRFTQAAFKLIRGLRAHGDQPTSLPQARLHLQRLYAKL